jgi:hypothetical protein
VLTKIDWNFKQKEGLEGEGVPLLVEERQAGIDDLAVIEDIAVA